MSEMSHKKEELTDHELINAFKTGSMEAIEKIVEKYENRIFSFGLRMCGQLQDAEDITQETFLNAFRYLDGFREETKLKNWLFKIAARLCLRQRRKKKSQPEHEISIEELLHNDDSNNGQYEIPDISSLPSDEILRAELKKVINKAIRSLPPKYRVVFNLRDIEGFNTNETANILGISPQSVKTRLHRARLFLREKISSYFKEDNNNGL